jgi:tetratricopeptide (TPR) repeat protein
MSDARGRAGLAAFSLVAAIVLGLCSGCDRSAHGHYSSAQMKQAAGEFQPALDDYNKALEIEPQSHMALYGKAYCTYKLNKYSEALPLFEQFLKDTEAEMATYKDQRYDAEFYRDKCKQELGQEVPQNPCDIPPPPMGE